MPKTGIERDRARTGGQREIIVLAGLAVDGRPMREERAIPAGGRNCRQAAVERDRAIDSHRCRPCRIDRQDVPLPALKTIPPLISLLSAAPWPRSIVPIVLMNCTGPPSLLQRPRRPAPPKVSWPNVFFSSPDR